MKMYLSSYELGNETKKLKKMVPANKKLGYVFNALDFTGADQRSTAERVKRSMAKLNALGFDCVALDLKEYFGKPAELRAVVDTLGAVWVSGGNVFVLRQACKLSGFDRLLLDLNQKDDFLYGGFSAGVCVLAPTLNGYQLVDDATDTPFDGLDEVIWDGLGLIGYTFLPHFESNHPESEDIGRALDYLKGKGLPYRTARDGDVIIIQ